MTKLPDWMAMITTPPALIGIWFVDDIRILRVIAFFWGLSALCDAIGFLAGFTVLRPDTSHLPNTQGE